MFLVSLFLCKQGFLSHQSSIFYHVLASSHVASIKEIMSMSCSIIIVTVLERYHKSKTKTVISEQQTQGHPCRPSILFHVPYSGKSTFCQ